MKLTLDGLKEYLAQLEPLDIAGTPLSMSRCLIASYALWLLKDEEGVMVRVRADNTQVTVVYVNENRMVLDVPDDIMRIADKFDYMDRYFVTRKDLESAMPELFAPHE